MTDYVINPVGMVTGDAATSLADQKFEESRLYARETYEKALALFGTLLDTSIVQSQMDLIKAGLGQIAFNRTENPVSNVNIPQSPVRPEFYPIDIADDIPKPVFKRYTTWYSSALLHVISNKLTSWIEDGGTGLSPTVEQAIWERSKFRQELENDKTYSDIRESYAARGWMFPPGAMIGQMDEARARFERNLTLQNDEIAIAQAELEQKNIQFAIAQGQANEKLIMDYTLEAWKTDAMIFQTYVQEMDALVRREIGIIQATTEANKALSNIYEADASVFKTVLDAILKAFEQDTTQAVAEANVALEKAKVELQDAIQIYTLDKSTREASARIASQLCASAMGSVNASAQVGFHEQRSDGTSNSSTQGLHVGINNGYSVNHNYQHKG